MARIGTLPRYRHTVQAISQESISVHMTSFSITFCLLNIHFLYRYWSVKKWPTIYIFEANSQLRPENIALFSNWRFVLVLSLYPLVQGVTWWLTSLISPFQPLLRFNISQATIRNGNLEQVPMLRKAFIAQYRLDVDGMWLVMDYWVIEIK